MKKFLIQCKKCGIFHEGKNGFFASKVIPCHCGHVIDIKKEKIARGGAELCRRANFLIRI